MAGSEAEQALSQAAADVLETMFFTNLAEEGVPAPLLTEPSLSARLSFRGDRFGCLGLRVPLETAREIAGNFLGLEGPELTEARVGEVICELSNMVCGSLLGRLERNGLFALARPELQSGDTAHRRSGLAVFRTLVLEAGVMEVWLEWERPQ